MIAFSGSPLDRAEALRRDPSALEALALREDARWLVLDGLKPVMTGEGGAGGIRWATREEVLSGGEAVLLGLMDGAPRFAVAGPALPGGVAVDTRAAAMVAPGPDLGIIAHARSLIDWHATHRFCARCGAATVPARGGAQRQCEACGTEHYPRVNPVVIMLVVDRARDVALLGRGSRMPPGFVSALAGFVEAGESLEEAVRREVREEAGIEVGAVHYVASQPWPFPSSLMLGCIADALTAEIRIDPHEIESAGWFDRTTVSAAMAGRGTMLLPPKLAIAHHLIARWLDCPGDASINPLPQAASVA